MVHSPTPEQETAMYDQPVPESDMVGEKTLGYDISGVGKIAAPTGFAKRVIDILSQAHDVYRDRNAEYKDNFRTVGRVMVALFPDGRPPLKTAEDYDRWHIFELLIVKLTRYANNYDQPHEDSLLDQLPYLGILGALDQELRERQARDAAPVSAPHEHVWHDVSDLVAMQERKQECPCGASRMVAWKDLPLGAGGAPYAG